ncbi:MAG: ABC-F family ATP-binding cassette domain-containing protein [Lachnospiraceae bacterium]|nr:ABC-F family ATP-binding cassette domain-containing protein [Lachnospiraceae bacterium]
MIMSLNNVSLSFGDKNILNNITFLINEGEKVALIGDNGTGKSTLLKTVTGELSVDSGDIVFKKDIKIGYVAQHQDLKSDKTVYEELLSCKASLIETEEKIRSMEEEMKSIDEKDLASHMEKYHSLTEIFEKNGGYTYKSEINGVINGLDFSDFTEKNISLLSGGERTRLMLGKILLEKPDLILLDEPTNYLDISSVEWLENYLKSVNAAVLFVSHDRYFINRIADRVMEITPGKLIDYKGNYDEFTIKKEQYIESLSNAYENQQREIKHQMEVIRKLRSFNREKSIKRADSRQKMLDKIEVLDKPTNETSEMRLFLTPNRESGKDVLSVKNISKRFEDKNLFENISFEIKKGEHVALIGANGTGKTSILKIINDIYTSDTLSEIKFGSNVEVGYFDQQANVIDDNKTLFDEISDTYPNMTQTEIRNTLGAFLFSDDDVFKKIGVLSGGEKCRVVLAKIMLSKANLLILDEPTNHLDMTSKQILEEALVNYEGTCLYVSHDRYFINKTADRILCLENNKITEYLGNYDYYLEKKNEIGTIVNKGSGNANDNNSKYNNQNRSNENAANDNNVSDSKLNWQEQKQLQSEKRKIENKIKNIESEIEKLENRSSAIDEEMLDPKVSSNSFKLNELCSQKSEIESRLAELYDEWETLSLNN